MAARIIEDCGCKVMEDEGGELELKYCAMHQNAHKMFWAIAKARTFINDLVLHGIAAFNPERLTAVWGVLGRTAASVEIEIEKEGEESTNQQGETDEKARP